MWCTSAHLTQTAALRVNAMLALKGDTLDVLRLSEHGCPRTLYRFDQKHLRNTGIAIARGDRAAIFEENGVLLRVNLDGTLGLVGCLHALLPADCELNWEVATDDSGRVAYVTDFSLKWQSSSKLRIWRCDFGKPSARSFAFEFPDSGAYVLDASSGRVAYLRANHQGSPSLVVVGFDCPPIETALLERYHWVRANWPIDVAVVSSADDASVTIAGLVGAPNSLRVIARGAAANWAGRSQLVYRVGTALKLFNLETSTEQELCRVADGWSFDGVVGPVESDEAGNILVWSVSLSDPRGNRHSATVIIDLVTREYRILDKEWYRQAIVAFDGEA